MRNLLLVVLLLGACASTPSTPADVNRVLDDWHQAAAVADEARYFGAMSPDFVFLGTDATERWDLAAFREFSHPYFAKGKAWTFVPRDRHVMFSP
ncbi:MAG TPA: nuclear transport factor 2 family protein, partial [Thermoanaerobaculia bacterium]|nr:nuclear transport factor 2 family protein [Thermoanaerobaculia bacterium]